MLPLIPKFLFAACCALAASLGSAVEKPNILWITADDLSPNLGCYGDTFARTPHLDAFASGAVRYTRAFAVAPACAPSRATLITGVWATSLGNPHLRGEITLPPGFEGYPANLRRAGYFTTNNSKTDYNLQEEAKLVRAWWDRSDSQAHWRQRSAGQPFMAVFNLMETHQSRVSVWPEEEFQRQIGSQIPPGERADPAKTPVPPFYPDNQSSRKAMARYYDSITVMDREVGELLAELESDGLADDTIVFFYSDHGMGMPRGKRLLHDSGMRVPLIIRFPEKWAHLAPAQPGGTVERLVSFADFAPTVLSLAGAEIPSHYQGATFLGAAAEPAGRYVFGARDRVDEVFDTARSVRDERWLYIRNYRPHLSWAPPEWYSDASAFRRELLESAHSGELGSGPTRWLAPKRPREELYDTLTDPYQLRNLASNEGRRGELSRMRDALRDWLVESRDLGFLPEEDVLLRADDLSPFEMARQPGLYPFEAILAAAERVGDNLAVEQQRDWLAHRDSGIRYWAAVGFAANPQGARQARQELEQALDDSASAVRIEAAGALLAVGSHGPALALLGREVSGGTAHAALHAARTLELLGAPAEPLLPQLRERLAFAQARKSDSHLEFYIGMSLESLVTELETAR